MSYLIAYCHPPEVAHSFHRSMLGTLLHDLYHDRQLAGTIMEECAASRIIDGRNRAVTKFLGSDSEWLMWVDADMGWEPQAIDQLLAVADPEARPIVGGLCFAQKKGPDRGAGSRWLLAVPTLYRWVETEDTAGFAPITDYPRSSLVKVDGTGSAFLLIHRRVFEQVAARFAGSLRPWYDETPYKGQVFSEDLTFCRRAAEAGFPVHVHTGVQASHLKHVYLDEVTAGALTAPPTFVVVPQRNRTDLTETLLRDLEREGGWDRIFVFDNGSDADERERLAKIAADIAGVEVVDAPDRNIHQMWNAGLELACRRAWPCNVAILNNDLRLGDAPLQRMAETLRSDPLLSVVSANYDGRAGDKVQHTADICAGRYDGSGGVAGFAFMLRAETGYRFPEQLRFWYGDNDMMMALQQAGCRAAIVRDAHVEHVGGGSQTADWSSPEMVEALAADRAFFDAKWRKAA